MHRQRSSLDGQSGFLHDARVVVALLPVGESNRQRHLLGIRLQDSTHEFCQCADAQGDNECKRVESFAHTTDTTIHSAVVCPGRAERTNNSAFNSHAAYVSSALFPSSCLELLHMGLCEESRLDKTGGQNCFVEVDLTWHCSQLRRCDRGKPSKSSCALLELDNLHVVF